MIIEAGKAYWDFRQKYALLAPNAQKMVLQGQALLLLRDTPNLNVKRRLQAFIVLECNRHRMPDKTATYM